MKRRNQKTGDAVFTEYDHMQAMEIIDKNIYYHIPIALKKKISQCMFDFVFYFETKDENEDGLLAEEATRVAARVFGVDKDTLFNKSNKQAIVFARYCVYAILRKYSKHTYKKMAGIFTQSPCSPMKAQRVVRDALDLVEKGINDPLGKGFLQIEKFLKIKNVI